MKANPVGRRWFAIGLSAPVLMHLYVACAGAMAAGQHLPPSFAQLIAAASPSVVNIAVKKPVDPAVAKDTYDDMRAPFGGMFYNAYQETIPREYLRRTMGSGFIVDREGI